MTGERAQVIQLLLDFRSDSLSEIKEEVESGKKPPKAADQNWRTLNKVISKVLAG